MGMASGADKAAILGDFVRLGDYLLMALMSILMNNVKFLLNLYVVGQIPVSG